MLGSQADVEIKRDSTRLKFPNKRLMSFSLKSQKSNQAKPRVVKIIEVIIYVLFRLRNFEY